jgi:hypothetical protein
LETAGVCTILLNLDPLFLTGDSFPRIAQIPFEATSGWLTLLKKHSVLIREMCRPIRRGELHLHFSEEFDTFKSFSYQELIN